MSEDKKKTMKLEIMPGAFDHFEGTQEELNELMAQLNQMVSDGSIFENSEPINMEDFELEDPEMFEILSNRLKDFDSKDPKKLN